MGFSGKDGSSTGLHLDYHDNIYVVLKGKKKFEIYSPDSADRLPTFGEIRRVQKNGLVCYDLEIKEDGHYSEDEYD